MASMNSAGRMSATRYETGGSLFQLRWDDQWGGATIDLDLYLYDLDSGVHMGPLVSSNDVQSGAAGDIPYEEIEYWPDHSGTYCLAVRHHSGDIPDWIQLTGWNSELEHHTLFGSIGNPAESASSGMLAVGAAPSDDIFTIEEFSSRGPATDGRVKPDIVGADQGDSAVWGHWSGTSQASPHVAGLAALVKQRFPDYSPTQIADYLKDHAEERGIPGPDNTWGYGFAKLPALDEAPSVFIDRAALVAFYNATNGDDWTDSTGWLTDAHIYGWYGVTVNIDGSVTRLTLEDNNLVGEMPAELGNLSSLESLNLWNNHLAGEIPAELSNLTQLRALDIGRNQLEGEIPPELGSISNLEELWLQDNQLTGSIPVELADLSDLDALFLAGNQLTGCIPEALRDIPDNDFADTGLLFCDEEPPDPCVQQLTGDGIVNGSWTTESACVSENRDGAGAGAYARYYTFTLTEQSELTIVLESAADTYLYLLEGAGRDGKQVAENDDIDVDGGDYNSRIVGTFEPGDYTIEATTYEAEVSGTFTLTVEGLGDSAIPPAPSSDRDVLVALYNATDGPYWDDDDNWLSGADIGEWWGVTTDENGHVIQLDLPNNDLNGTLPPELGRLSNLNDLNLYANQLTGSIPLELSNLTKLRNLDLGNNQLSGHIPPQLNNLTNLEELLLDENELTGTIPPELGNLRELESLLLNENQLTGNIPLELGNLTELGELLLAGNQLTGCIPDALRDVENNDFTELDLPFCESPERAALVALYHATDGPNWHDNDNWLTDEPLDNWDGVDTNDNGRVDGLELDDNNLTGELPAELGDLSNLTELYVNDNQLTGTLPHSLTNLTQLTDFNFDDNAGLCAPNDATFLAWLKSIGSADGVVCGPPLPRDPRDMAGLTALYHATNGDNWVRNDNWLTDAPLKDWHGVRTDFDGRVTHLSFQQDNLVGQIPAELGDMDRLEWINFRGNELTGQIPADLGRLTNLRRLQLGNNQLSGQIPLELVNLGNLGELMLGENQLSGTIPPELAKLPSLKWLFLDNNELTGSIPQELGSLNNLQTLRLNSNQLTGQIPPQLGNLDHIVHLDLSNNELTGSIPQTFGRLEELRQAYFAGNQLTGCIPDALRSVEDNDFAVLDLPFCDNPDRAVLITFFHVTDGPNWTENDNWLTDAPLEDWHGVHTDDYGRVNELNLYDNNLSGHIPSELGNLSNLEESDLGKNHLSGQIPRELGNLTRVTSLLLDENELTGAIPTELGDLRKLETLYLNENQLTGHIPLELSYLINLDTLLLDNNELTGEIPRELGDLTDLSELKLAGNQFTGCIPDTLRDVEDNDFEELDLPFCSEQSSAFEDCVETLSSIPYESSGVGMENIWSSDCESSNRPGSYARFYTLTLHHSFDVTITLTSEQDVYLYLMGGIGADGIVLHENDDYEGLNSRIQVPLHPGNYTIEATTHDAGAEGEFYLEVDADDSAPIPPPAELTDRAALTAFYHAANGPGWHDSDNWLTDFPLSEWRGVESDDSGRVIRLDLEANNLSGELPLEFGNLDQLQWVNISHNQLTGELSRGLTNLTTLVYFYFDNNAGLCAPDYDAFQEWAQSLEDFRGDACPPSPPNTERDTLITLYYATRGDNWRYHTGWLTGAPLREWYGVTTDSEGRVVDLNLDSNNLVGHIPLELGNLTNLQRLRLVHSKLMGDIPLELGNLTNLKSIDLRNNNLSGEIPAELGSLINLERLEFGSNNLSGGIPVELARLANLESLGLDDNDLTGTIPSELGNLTHLEWLSLKGNGLNGAIPQELASLTKLEGLFLAGNKLTGCIPDALRDVEENDFAELDLPFCESPSRAVLIAFYHATNGDNWYENDNWLTDAPLHEWKGVSADDNGRVVGLDLSYLNLSGHIPSELSNLKRLKVLDVHENELSGPIPPELGSLYNLEYLFLSSNELSGHIPPELDKLTKLKNLDLDDNRLTGQIPSELGNLKNLEVLHLSNNELSGQMPPELGDLAKLQILWLDNNRLSGEIPSELGNLSNLERLSLDSNGFTGELPRSLTNLTRMDYFYFDTNASLCAPSDDAFQNWLETIFRYQGKTCGASLPPPDENDISALTAIYHAVNGEDWHNNTNWLTDAHPSDWYGVTVDDGRVVELNLEDNNLSGQIPSELGSLTALSLLNLSGNDFMGEIPREIGSLVNLQSLHISSNYQLSGQIPSELGNLVNLQSLRLSANHELSGEIPPELGKLTNLTELDLSNNRFSGEIPPELANLTDLTRLALYGNELTGTIPPELGNLTSLEDLELGFNRLSGEIPVELGSLINLEWLYLWHNNLSGEIPVEIGNLTDLRHLILDRNELTGEIPAELGDLINLAELRLNDNQLSGHISVELGNLTELRTLDLSHNQLTGGIPSELGTLSYLEVLNLADNDLTGEIPPKLADLGTLKRLVLWDNDLTAEAFLPLLSEMTTLERLSLSGNAIDGADVLPHLAALPNLTHLGLRDTRLTTDQLMPHLADITGLEYLILSDNRLTGDRLLPMLAEFNRLIDLEVSGNELTGEIPPELGNLSRLRVLLLDDNQLTGEVPAELGNLDLLIYLRLNDNRLTGEVPAELGNLSSLYDLRLNDNRLTGALPQTFTQLEHLNEITFHNNDGLCAPADVAFQEWLHSIDDVQGPTCSAPIENSDRAALIAFYDATDGDKWDNSTNWLTDAPLHEWYGVKTDEGLVTRLELRYNNIVGEIPLEIGSLVNLETLDLSRNELTEAIPSELGSLAKLETLDLSANSFSGNIPSELAKLGNLKSLLLDFNDLTGRIPPELGNLANLETLDLGANSFSGNIPPELAKLGNLKSLSLEFNDLTGRIPSELGNLSNLEKLRLNNSNLSGTIPSELAALSNLKDLSLRRNELTGEIPTWIGNLSNLESLSLHFNNLTGEIPTELANLTKLESLELYFNYLSGEIPPELGALTNLTGLGLDGNNLTGEVPSELGSLTALYWLGLSDNLLTGTLPHSLTALAQLEEFVFHHNAGLCAPADESFQNWLQDIEDFEGNICGVQSPPSNQDDIAALTALYNATNGDNWKRNRNWLSDTHVSEWYGVTTDADGRVVRLSLSANNLSGTLPPALGNLSNLLSFSLSRNQLTGEFPHELTRLANLTLLYFYDNAGLCAPADAAFQQWLQSVINVSGDTCDAPPPYPERTWAINRSLTIDDFTMHLHQITDTEDGLRVEYSYETDLSGIDYLLHDDATIRYPDGSIHDPYMARLPEEGEDIDVSLGAFLVFDAVLEGGSVDIPMASVSDDGELNPQPELLVGDRRYGVTKLLYEDEYKQITFMIHPLNEAAKQSVFGIGSGLDESTSVILTDDFGTASESFSGSHALHPFETTLDFQTFDFLAVSPERFASVTKFTLTVRGGGNIVGPFVFEDVRLASEDARTKPPSGSGEDAGN